MIDVVIYLVFVLALMAFSLSPAIYLSEKISDKCKFMSKHSTKVSIILAFVFSVTATTFIFQF